MIDFHSHILPKIDDGAKDVEMSLRMIEESKRQGVTTLVCTPHYYGKKRSPKQFIEKRRASFDMIKEQIPDGIELKLGAEVFFTSETTINYDDLSMLCIEGTRYIMFELPFTKTFSESLLGKIDAFISETGCTPIIAHIDRYPAVLKSPAYVKRLLEIGCLFQVNVEAFSARGAKSFAMALLKKGLIHAIGTDTHNVEDRAPNMSEFETLLRGMPEGVAERLTQTQKAILSGEAVAVEVKSVGKFFGKYF